jgi:hypothetical protein
VQNFWAAIFDLQVPRLLIYAVSLMTTRRANLPPGGDVAPSVAAERMGFVTVHEFAQTWPELVKRGFPQADPTTGRYCLEAIDRWRLLRTPRLFPELTVAPAAIQSENVMFDRIARIGKA